MKAIFEQELWLPDLTAPLQSGIDSIDGRLRGLPARGAASLLAKAMEGSDLSVEDLTLLFGVEGLEEQALFATAHFLQTRTAGRLATYVVNRNINFTNICYNGCRFCAYRRPLSSSEAFSLSAMQVLELAKEARELGATEVCIQAGLSPDLDSSFYPQICRLIRRSLPDIHIHGCSPQEVVHWAGEAGRTVRDYLVELKDAGLDSLPGTSAEILDDHIRAVISPRRISTAQWTEVIETAHCLGFHTSATIMYGHFDTVRHRASHILHIRELQRRTRGFTEFVPLSLISDSGRLKRSLQTRDVLKMHAIARLALAKDIPNIQVSWVKEGVGIAQMCLQAGANDLGGTLMNESISSSAGAKFGELMRPSELRAAIRGAGLIPAQRDTLYHILRRFDDPAQDPVDPLDRASSNSQSGTRREGVENVNPI